MTITSADYGSFGAAAETPPAGSGCASSGPDGEAIPGGHPMTTQVPGGRYGRDQREPPQHLQHEVHSSAATLAGPQGENADGKVYCQISRRCDGGCRHGPCQRGRHGAGSSADEHVHRPGRAGRPLQRHGRSELAPQGQLAERGPHGGMAWSNHQQRRPGHSSGSPRQPVDRGDTGGVGRPDKPGSAVALRQPVDRGDTGGVGGPDQPGESVPLQQPVDRGDTGGVGGPDQPGESVPLQQPVDRGDTGGVGGPDQPGRAGPLQQPVDRGDTGGVGGPGQPDSSAPLQQPVDRGDTGGVGQPDQPGTAVALLQPVDRGDTGGVGAA